MRGLGVWRLGGFSLGNFGDSGLRFGASAADCNSVSSLRYGVGNVRTRWTPGV